MTNKELEKRAVACKHWRWMPGMRCVHRWTGGIRVLVDESGQQSESYVVLPDNDGSAVMTIDECGIMGGFPEAQSAYPFVPDLDDPATVGCLLALVREALGGHVYVDVAKNDHATVWLVDAEGFSHNMGSDPNGEAGGLVAALESAGVEG